MLELYKNIKKYRLEKQMSQSRLAELVGYSDKGMISRIENGKVDLPQSQIKKFADALNVSPAKLMGWDEKPPFEVERVSENKYVIEYSPEEQEIIKGWRDTDDQTRTMIKRLLMYAELCKGDKNG
jgi:transcriptional regulator with XRE-family HTH domain